MKYDIQLNPYNPVEYLAACGVVEILARFDADALSWWELDKQPRCWLESRIDEAALLRCLKQTLTDWSAWQTSANVASEAVEQDDEEEMEETAEESNEGLLLSLTFHLNDQKATLHLDWWYETLNKQRRVETKGKSAWKMYAANQTAEKIYCKMMLEAASLLQQTPITKISELIKLSVGMKGRFGFDPRSSRNALDAGFSANDLGLRVATYVFAEMLSSIAVQSFFPHRAKQSGGITSSRGWIENNAFQYALWKSPLPITLARMAASGAAINRDNLALSQAERVMRGKFSNFKMAKPAAWPEEQPARFNR